MSNKNKKRRKLRPFFLSFFPRFIFWCFSAPIWMCWKNSIIESFIFFVNFLEVRSTKTRRRNLTPSLFLSSFQSLYLLNSDHFDQIVAVLFLDVQSSFVASAHCLIAPRELRSNIVLIKASCIDRSRNVVSPLCLSPVGFIPCCYLSHETVVISFWDFCPKLKFLLCKRFSDCFWFFVFCNSNRARSFSIRLYSLLNLLFESRDCWDFISLTLVCVSNLVFLKLADIFVYKSAFRIYFIKVFLSLNFVIVQSWLLISFPASFKDLLNLLDWYKIFLHNWKFSSYKWWVRLL